MTTAEMDSLRAAAPRDTTARRAYVRRVEAGLDRALHAARADARQRAAYMRLGFHLATGTPLSESLRTRLRASLPPSSRWWALANFRVQGMTMLLLDTPGSKDFSSGAVARRRRAQAYLARMAASIGEPEVRSEARYELIRLTYAAGDSARAQMLLDRLLAEQPDYPFSRLAAARFSKTTLLRRGAPMPAFDFAALPDTTAPRITNAAIRGTLTLVNFWGTWCGPCRAELPALAHVYAKYHARGLNIVSVAADDTPDVVNQFMRTNPSISWISAYGGRVDAPVFRRLGVLVFPRTVLIDAQGRIVASDGGVTEAELTAMVDSALRR